VDTVICCKLYARLLRWALTVARGADECKRSQDEEDDDHLDPERSTARSPSQWCNSTDSTNSQALEVSVSNDLKWHEHVDVIASGSVTCALSQTVETRRTLNKRPPALFCFTRHVLFCLILYNLCLLLRTVVVYAYICTCCVTSVVTNPAMLLQNEINHLIDWLIDWSTDSLSLIITDMIHQRNFNGYVCRFCCCQTQEISTLTVFVTWKIRWIRLQSWYYNTISRHGGKESESRIAKVIYEKS